MGAGTGPSCVPPVRGEKHGIFPPGVNDSKRVSTRKAPVMDFYTWQVINNR